MILTVVLLFIGGIALAIAEIFLPGGILGVIGGLLLLASMGLGAYYYPEYSVFIIVGEVLVAVLAVIGGLVFIAKSGVSGPMVLQESQLANEGWVSNPSDESLVGQEGEVYSTLRPAGSIVINGDRIPAVSDGSFIEKGERVRVIEVHGNRVVVERAATPQEDPESA